MFSGVRGDNTSQSCPGWIFGDTWTWDGRNWAQLHPQTSPPGRSNGSLAYDPAHGNTVLFGGGSANSDPFVTDTWTWDGTNWTQQHPATAPPYFDASSLTYDAARRVVVLVGSHGGETCQTWLWNGSNWLQQRPAHAPPFRFAATLAYDASRGAVVLFGGYQMLGASLTDTWTWDGIDWSQQNPHSHPGEGFGFGAYDAARGHVVFFGVGQTWTWNGNDWTLQHPVTSPETRGLSAMAYDEAIGKVVLFGGKIEGPTAETVTNETWLWDGTTWIRGG